MATQQRALLSDLVAAIDTLTHTIAWMGDVSAGDGTDRHTDTQTHTHTQQDTLRQALSVQATHTETAVEALGQVYMLLVSIHSAMKKTNTHTHTHTHPSTISLLASWEGRLKSLAERERHITHTHTILTHTDAALLKEGTQLVQEAEAALAKCQHTHIHTLAPPQVLDSARAALVQAASAGVSVDVGVCVNEGVGVGVNEDEEDKKVKEALEGVVEACLLSVQGLNAARRGPTHTHTHTHTQGGRRRGRRGRRRG